MKKEKKSSVSTLRLTLTLLLISAVVAGILAGVNAGTKDIIAQHKAEKTQAALTQVLPDAKDSKLLNSFPDQGGVVQAVYASETGYAVQVAPNGFGGPITMMVGVDKSGTVLGVSVVSLTETPGLGAVAGDLTTKGAAFRGQFQGMSGDLAVTKDGGAVEAISGATITSRAVTAGVNAAIACASALSNG